MVFPLLESYYHSKINFIEKYDFGRIDLSFEIKEHTISIGRWSELEIICNFNNFIFKNFIEHNHLDCQLCYNRIIFMVL